MANTFAEKLYERSWTWAVESQHDPVGTEGETIALCIRIHGSFQFSKGIS